MTKGTHQRVGWQIAKPVGEICNAIGNEFLPGGTASGMLLLHNTFAPRVVEDFSKHGVVGNSHLAFLSSVGNVNDFNGVGENGQAMGFEETQHD